MARSGQLPTALLLDSPPAPKGRVSTVADRALPARPGLHRRPGLFRRGEAALLGAPRWGGSRPVCYPFKPGRDGSCQRQPRLARDVAARQARARSREANGERRWRRGRCAAGPLAAR